MRSDVRSLSCDLAGDLIDMAFSKERIAERKEWMSEGRLREQTALEEAKEAASEAALLEDSSEEQVLPEEGAGAAASAAATAWKRRSIEEFVQSALVSHSLAAPRRSVP